MAQDRELDIVLFGATGFTGQLTAQHLLRRHGVGGELRWALAGRNRAKLEATRSALGEETGVATSELPLIVADGDDDASLLALAERTRVVCTTVGPYMLYGSRLVAACARAGTHYCDLTGEVHWMRQMIDAHHDEAVASGARIVHTCGFDCIPSDIGAFFIQSEMARLHDSPCKRIKAGVVGFSGAASGGTIASMFAMIEAAARDPEVRRVMANPYGLNPKGEQSGPDAPDHMTPAFDADFDQWTGPFVMAQVNTRVVRRSNALLGSPTAGFAYDEVMLTGKGATGFAKAAALSAGIVGGMGAMAIGPIRRFAAPRMPQPGSGPSKNEREDGYWDIELFGEHPSDPSRNLRGRMTGDMDPGYGSTSKMLGESALCLALDALDSRPGFSTPAAAMGNALLARLREHAGCTFETTASSTRPAP